MTILMISRATLMSSPGGDTIQVKETASHLRKLGITVDIVLANTRIDYSKYNLIHFFNIIRPSDILVHIERSGLPYVVSTIFVDYSESERNTRSGFLGFLGRVIGSNVMEYVKVIARALKNGEKINSWKYLLYGHSGSIKKIIRGAKMLLPNSENEYRRLRQQYNVNQSHLVVPNAINPDIFSKDEPRLRSGVLCVARIEPRKNQLNLIRAMKGINCKLTIIGSHSPNHKAYYKLCRQESGENVEFIDHLNQHELASLYATSKVHVLASWFETTGLSSLEAGVCGCNIVITDKGDTREYFGDHAFYCEPDDTISIRTAVINALNAEADSGLVELIKKKYTWQRAAEQTLISYKMSLNAYDL